MNMKKLIESMDHIEECGMAEGPMGMAPPAPEMDKGNPVTVNVSMNASGKEHVADLLDMMKNAGLGDAAPAADAMMSPRMDMERLSGIMGKPADGLDDKEMNLPAIADLDGGEDESYAAEMDGLEDELAADMDEGAVKNAMIDDAESMDKEDFCEKYMAQGMDRAECEEQWNSMNEAETEDMSGEGTYTVKVKGKNMDSQNELARIASLSGVSAPQEMETEAAGDYANEPDEQYSDLSAVIPDGDDLHKQKKSHPAVSGGDNPMAIENIKAALYAALNEKKMPMGPGPDGEQGTGDDKPAFLNQQTGDKKSKGGSKPKKGQVPPQFQKGKKDTKTAEGRGRGKKTKLTAGRGRGK